MTNQERIQRRIARDKTRKAEKKKEISDNYGDFDKIVSHQSFHKSLKKRRRNTEWKGSVQRYIQHAIIKIKRAIDSLRIGKLNLNQVPRHLTIVERGKRRDCNAVMIDARVIQGAVCDSGITPSIDKSLIYDNPASTKGKGVEHARKRIMRQLRKSIRNFGTEFYILTYDFTNFFGSLKHSLCLERLQKAGFDERLQALTMELIRMYHRQDISLLKDSELSKQLTWKLENNLAVGATLGSQISQDMAKVTPNDLDHRIKDKERVKSYIRYMDDGELQDKSKGHLKQLLETIREECRKLGLTLNAKKTRITKSTRGFLFLKIRYTITKTGGVIRQMDREGFIRMRRKLKKFRAKVDKGEMTLDDVFSSFKSWFGNAKKIAQTYRSRKRMLNLYNDLFKCYKTGGMVA